ncbi:hypothetical protein PGS10_11460 [Klebsiella sp. 141153]|uniref:hypothetical protein n=1 Tax=Klebsiella sp. 141153 TaxID=3020033 RepID=UPI0029288E93|nr:hypothetical protein [Klebsiella sp. 141153]MDU9355258.1 hypothetical protein [Klebsiella sp. 141153]
MTQMVFRHGGTKKWKGVGYDFEIISEDDLQKYLDAGWFAHPDGLLNDVEEPEPEEKPRKKTGRKPKAATDESND